MVADDVRAVQRLSPHIYHAAHVQHRGAQREHPRLSDRDASLLAHLDRTGPVSLSVLAKHLGLALSTVSEALEHLAALGYVERHRSTRDRRAVSVRLTELGVSAMQATSVLDTKRLEALLEQLTAAERRAAVHGLELFAVASARLKAKVGPRPRSPKT